MCWFRFWLGPVVEWCVIAQRAKGENMRPFLLQAVGRCLGHRITLEPPDKKPHAVDTGPSAAVGRVNTTDVYRAGQLAKGAAGQIKGMTLTHIGGPAMCRAQMIERL